MKLWEIGATAPLVIGYRLAGMARAVPEPHARDQREFTRMGQEKVNAWYEATLAMTQRLVDANLAMAGVFWRQAWNGGLSPVGFATGLTRLGSGLLADSVTPVHRRVVANNRRLSRQR